MINFSLSDLRRTMCSVVFSYTCIIQNISSGLSQLLNCQSIFSKVSSCQMLFNMYVRLLTDHQSGFRPFHSTLTALPKDTMYWLNNMDNGLISIDHHILLRKLKFYGIFENELCWFKSYLYNS